ncbi:Uncharacterised protein [Mycobacteroides abscessus]|nr:Uncharacterised protein [Mycobacteroides abscessus]
MLEDLEYVDTNRQVGQFGTEHGIVCQGAVLGRHRPRVNAQLIEAHLQHGCHCPAAALELKEVLRDGPPLVNLPEHIGPRHTYVVEEHDILYLLAGTHHQGFDVYARRREVDENEGDTELFLGPLGGANKGEHPIRLARMGGPDLGAIEDEVITVGNGRHLQRGQVRPRLGLAVPLTEEHLAREDPGQEELFLFRAAELDDGMCDHPNSHGRQ